MSRRPRGQDDDAALQAIAGSVSRLKIAVGIATTGRRETLSLTLAELALQGRAPDLVIVCPAVAEDCDHEAMAAAPFPVRIVQGPRGLCAQRNAILRSTEDADIVAFFDDDFFPCRDFLAELEVAFAERSDAVIVTGAVAADGATGPGLTPAEARRVLLQSESESRHRTYRPTHSAYGCNMAIRLESVRRHDLRFDEMLPLYGWLEDVDFSRRLVIASGGMAVVASACVGVHLGQKAGRMSGVRFGYSQIANPLYILGKGVLTPAWAINQILRNVLANLLRWANPEPWVDRRGRLRGNLLAVKDFVTGRMRPDAILKLN